MPHRRLSVIAGYAVRLVLALGLLGCVAPVVAAQAALDPRTLIVQRGDLGAGWVTVDDGPSDQTSAQHFALYARVQPDGTRRVVGFQVALARDTSGSDFFVAQVLDAFHATGARLSDVPGLGDGPAYGSVGSIANGEVRAQYVFRIRQVAALIQVAGPEAARTDVQSAAMENARR